MKYILYIHGFMSGANGTKGKQLSKKLKNYTILTPELTADPDKSLSIINTFIEKYNPEIIIGTSLGGFMALTCHNYNAKVIVCNPCLNPYTEIARWLNEPQTYFCERIDGVQTYTLTQDVLDKYLNYDILSTIKNHKDNVYAICSSCDELLRDNHYKTLSQYLDSTHLIVSDKFDHRCSGEGFKILVNLIKNV